MTGRCFALIPAAGVGARTGASIPKQYLAVGGMPMLARTLGAFASVAAIERIVVVVATDDVRAGALLAPLVEAGAVRLVQDGGATRDRSVANGLVALAADADDDDWVLVHDAARCGITPALVERLIEAVRDDAVGGLLAVTLDDTVKRQSMGEGGRVVAAGTVDRRGLWRAQTPQMFRLGVLRDALAAARANDLAVTDEASAIEAAGLSALLVPGSARNFKVTTADDLEMMEQLLRAADDAGGEAPKDRDTA